MSYPPDDKSAVPPEIHEPSPVSPVSAPGYEGQQLYSDDRPPQLPPRPASPAGQQYSGQQQYGGQQPYGAGQQYGTGDHLSFPPPPQHPSMQRKSFEFTGDAEHDYSSPVHYTRDPHRLVGYLVPFPKPALAGDAAAQMPPRFMIYTPPPPPLPAPKEGEKEGKAHKVQRKWQNEVREAKTNPKKINSWKGVKGRVTKGVDWAMGQTTSSNVDFVNRIKVGKSSSDTHDKHADDGVHEDATTQSTVGLEEMVLVYPPQALTGTEEEIRKEFIENMLRTKSKAQRDAIVATGLMPVTYAIDILATVIWPFGGLGEIDTVWAVASIRGAKTARSVTKRLNSSAPAETPGDGQAPVDAPEEKGPKLKLTFTPSPRSDPLATYLAAECHRRDGSLFKSPGFTPTETDVVDAIGWSPSQSGGEERNWEDEHWELQEVKDDWKQVVHKAAREWDKWCKAYQKDPAKALKK